MYDWFMLITGIIFIILTIVTSIVLVAACTVITSVNHERELLEIERAEANEAYLHYMDAIERSNETVVEKFRHDLDCHKGELPY